MSEVDFKHFLCEDSCEKYDIGVSSSELQMSKETMILFQIYIIFWVTQHVEEYKFFSNQCLIVNNVLQGSVENWV